MKRCRVSFVDHEGVSHSVEVDAESLYEAVGLGIARLGRAEFVRYAPGSGVVSSKTVLSLKTASSKHSCIELEPFGDLEPDL